MATPSKKYSVLFFSPVGHFKGGAEKCLMEFIDNPAVTPAIAAPVPGPILDAAKKRNIPGYVVPFGDVETVHKPFSFSKGIKVFRSMLKAARMLKETARKENINLVHSNGLKAHAINCVSRRIGGAKAIVHIHDIPLTLQEKLVWYILYAMCDKMLMVSRPCWPGESLPPKCRVVHNGTILGEIVKRKAPSLDQPITAGFAGRIYPAKGLHLLLEWIAYARGKGLKIRLSVRGSFSEDAPHYQKEIEDLVEKLKLSGHVDFLGHIDNPEAVYKDIDFVVVPSKTPDSLPRSVMEPMALGLPVFGYPAGGIPEMIEDGKTGFLVRDETEFAEGIEKLIANYDNIVAGAREKIIREFSLDVLYWELESVYRKLSD